MSLEQQVALVTGASRGIGRAIAIELGLRGASVVVNYIGDVSDAQETLKLIHNGVGVHADIADPDEAQGLINTTMTVFERIDILVNNAAVLLPNESGWFDNDLYEKMYKVNVQGALNCIEAAAPIMYKQNYGRIINIASIRGVREEEKNREYARTKRVLLQKTIEYAIQLAPHITVNAISPGTIDAPMTRNPKASDERLRYESLVGRIGRSDEIAHAVAFLADPRAGYITGQNIIIDGGYLLRTALDKECNA